MFQNFILHSQGLKECFAKQYDLEFDRQIQYLILLYVYDTHKISKECFAKKYDLEYGRQIQYLILLYVYN